MCGRLVNLDTVARVIADYYHLKTDTQLAALDEALSRVPAVSVVGGYRKDHVVDPNKMVGDLISRQAAIDALSTITMYKGSIPFDTAVMRIEQLPSAQQERKKGKWIYHSEIGWGETWLCDQCGEKTTSTVMGKPRANYCPMCGADMRGENDG